MQFPRPDKLLIPQRDFSGGQINAKAKRRDDLDLVRAGGRQARNVRINSTGQGTNRPGRSALHTATGWRNDYVRMTPTARFKLGFSSGAIKIYNEDGALVASNATATYLWGSDDIDLISWAQAGFDIVICYPNMRPQIARYDRAAGSWSFLAFSFRVSSNTIRQPFYRASALGATMQASARTGTITLTCSTSYFDSSMIGSYISILGQQVLISGVTSATVATGVVQDKLPALINWTITTTGSAPFAVGDIVTGTIFGRTAEIIASTATTATGWLMDSINFYGVAVTTDETVVSGRSQASATAASDVSGSWGSYTVATVQWQAQFMGDGQGWPSRCAFAQNRLILFDFPQAPEAIAYSVIGQFDQFWVDSSAISNSQSAGAIPTSAMLEYVPAKRGKARVRHVVDVGDLLVFTDKGIWQIPISVQNPLTPGSVQHIDINADAVSNIPPVTAQDLVFYVNAGLSRVSVVRATGSQTRNFTSDDISDAHSDLIRSPVAMALETGDDKYPERLLYLVNGDGTVAVGRQSVVGEKVGFGWFLWDGDVSARWVTVGDTEVFFTEDHNGTYIVNKQDDDYHLDSVIMLNSPPAGMAATVPGQGTLWWRAGETVTLMSGLRDLGERDVDSNGDLVPIDGDDLTDTALLAGLRWTFCFEPFVANMQAGQSKRQRQLPRRTPKVAVSVIGSTGFEFGEREIPPYDFGEDTTIDPPLREKTYVFTSLGRSHDPRLPITKSRPGPITLVEVSVEATV